MIILSHRGYWQKEIEKNTLEAIQKSLSNGFGFESDIRDFNGELVISHNIPSSDSVVAHCVFEELSKYNNNLCFAINVKADGLENKIKEILKQYKISNYFTFDMSIPQMLRYRDMNLRYFTRQSEFELEPLLYEDADGVWIDSFKNEEWINEKLLEKHLESGKKVCIVSPELHRRNPETFWKNLRKMKIITDNIYLCSDFPVEASVFFQK